VTSAQTHGDASDCCLKNNNTRIRPENIVSYTVQFKGFCPITSVAFLTKANKKICWDPEEPYAQRTMKRVDQIREPERRKDVTTVITATIGQTTTQPFSRSNSTQTGKSEETASTRKTSRGKGKKRLRRRKGRKPKTNQ
uniref:Chemokine interleukin-8-like domain-containing protein n=1 Tax=Neogobius melanostomus TaxID=47308 RepID=A0A8C6TEF6_9GOBI